MTFVVVILPADVVLDLLVTHRLSSKEKLRTDNLVKLK